MAPSIVFIDEIDAVGTKRYAFSLSLFYSVSLDLRADKRMMRVIVTIRILVENEKFRELCSSC